MSQTTNLTPAQKKALNNLKASLRYSLVNNFYSFDLTTAEKANHLKVIHKTLTANMKVFRGLTYTCLLSSELTKNRTGYLALRQWYRHIVDITVESINSSHGNKNYYFTTFEVLASYIGYTDTNEFRLWFLEYCYKTLTKKGRI